MVENEHVDQSLRVETDASLAKQAAASKKQAALREAAATEEQQKIAEEALEHQAEIEAETRVEKGTTAELKYGKTLSDNNFQKESSVLQDINEVHGMVNTDLIETTELEDLIGQTSQCLHSCEEHHECQGDHAHELPRSAVMYRG